MSSGGTRLSSASPKHLAGRLQIRVTRLENEICYFDLDRKKKITDPYFRMWFAAGAKSSQFIITIDKHLFSLYFISPLTVCLNANAAGLHLKYVLNNVWQASVNMYFFNIRENINLNNVLTQNYVLIKPENRQSGFIVFFQLLLQTHIPSTCVIIFICIYKGVFYHIIYNRIEKSQWSISIIRIINVLNIRPQRGLNPFFKTPCRKFTSPAQNTEI